MYKTVICLWLALGLLACASQKSAPSKSGVKASSGHTRTKPVVFLDNSAFLVTDPAPDKSYGYEPSNPVKVGSANGGGPVNERRFLNGLRGPNGEVVSYSRAGSCCPFATPNGMMDMGMLDNYRVTWEGAKDTVNIFINMYDEGDLFIPAGFTGGQK